MANTASPRQRAFVSLAFRAVSDIYDRLEGDAGYMSHYECDVLEQCLLAAVAGKRCWPKLVRQVWDLAVRANLDNGLMTDEDRAAVRKLRKSTQRVAKRLGRDDLRDIEQANLE
jgi:hypothetical protein